MYVIINREHVKELVDAPEETLSSHESQAQLLQARYTLSESIVNDPYHILLLRRKLPRLLVNLVPIIVDEFHAAFEDEFGLVGKGFKSV